MSLYRIELWERHIWEEAPWQVLPGVTPHPAHESASFARTRLFFVAGQLSMADVERLTTELLIDPVIEDFSITPLGELTPGEVRLCPGVDHTLEVTPLPGVTDPVAGNLTTAAHLMGLVGLQQAATGERFLIRGRLSAAALARLATSVFSNPVVQQHRIDGPIQPPFVPVQTVDDTVDVIALRAADDAALLQISAARRLALDLVEMRAIQAYFRTVQRDPTDVELETLAQTWSEHCVHKTFRATVDFRGPDGEHETIHGLLKTYLRRATETLAKPWVRSAFVDNAGIVAFTDDYDLAFKMETHNHPSALEPFGGANTGVGGVVRDVLGVSARPIANTDVLCFGPQDLPEEAVPAGSLHPRRIQAGVVHGVEDYGNKMGIPTVNGAIHYHPGYTANPLVFCGCLGILPRGAHPTEGAQPGDLVIVVGGRTGRDGLRGATFSSMEMDSSTGEIAGSAVQIGHPINEKQTLEVTLQARDEGLYHAITDCGAGGLSSAVGEMGKPLGVSIQLRDVPLKYPGLRPWEIWLSEAQERMVYAVPPAHWARMQAICAAHDIEAVCIGTFEASGCLRVFNGETLVAEIGMDFLHEGIPTRHLTAVWDTPDVPADPPFPAPLDATGDLLALLAHPNLRSQEPVIRRYDHEVQGGTALKPLVGPAHGPGDAALLTPQDSVLSGSRPDGTSPAGLTLSVGLCPRYSELDPYAMAWAAVDEAVRNAVAAGADPDRIALLDNFCWGNPLLPDRMGSLVLATQGCHDAALAYAMPFVSGKDSLNNEYSDAEGGKHAIPGTLVISALGIVPEVTRSTSMDLKAAGNALYVLGTTRAELGGSHYALLRDELFGTVPQPNPAPLPLLRALHAAIREGLVAACHDCSEGGLGVALAEMCLAGQLGARIDLARLPGAADLARDDEALFAESVGRFVVEVAPDHLAAFEARLAGLPHARIGAVTADGRLTIEGRQSVIVQTGVETLERAWRGHMGPARSLEVPLEAPRNAAIPAPAIHVGNRRVAILHVRGTNRDRDAAQACELAGGQPEIVTVSALLAGINRLDDYHMLVVPGGFSYGDDLGAGMMWAFVLKHQLGESLRAFADSGRPVLGICNGFQVLVKTGLLPGADYTRDGADYTRDGAAFASDGAPDGPRPVTLTFNESGHFECRWVHLQANPDSPCLFTAGIDTLITCPVAHGEGRLAVRDAETLARLQAAHLNALTYVDAAGGPADYPANPNGSVLAIAGLTNPAGNVLGLMPHPENHIFPWQHPRWQRGESGMTGLQLFVNGLRRA